jgi:hypothetical protein
LRQDPLEDGKERRETLVVVQGQVQGVYNYIYNYLHN